MLICTNCGCEVSPGSTFCSVCGAKLYEPDLRMVESPVVAGFSEDQLPPRYKPISPWGYLGYILLFSIPVVGFILLIVYSLSEDNLNVRNFARSFWCALLIAFIVFCFALLITLLIAGRF